MIRASFGHFHYICLNFTATFTVVTTAVTTTVKNWHVSSAQSFPKHS